MKRFVLVPFALPFAFLVGAGCHVAAQQAQSSGAEAASAIKTPAPNAPAEMTFVSDDGKSTLASFHVVYGKRGATRGEQDRYNPMNFHQYQALKTSQDRLGDSDTLLLILDISGVMIAADKTWAVVAQGGAKYPAIGVGRLKPATPSDQVEFTPISGKTGFLGMLMPPSDADKSNGQWIWVFRLPPPSSHLTLKGVSAFSHVEFDAK